MEMDSASYRRRRSKVSCLRIGTEPLSLVEIGYEERNGPPPFPLVLVRDHERLSEGLARMLEKTHRWEGRILVLSASSTIS